MLVDSSNVKVYLVLGHTDMRKAVNGLSAMVSERIGLDPLSGHLFVFCNRSKDIIKVLYWDRNGFCLWYKRLERGRFRWPSCMDEVMELSSRELSWLLSGLEVRQPGAHRELQYGHVY